MNPPRNLERRDSDGRLIPYSQFAAPDDPTPWPRQFTLATRSVMAIMELVTIGYLGYYTQIMRNDGRDPRTGLAFAGVGPHMMRFHFTNNFTRCGHVCS